MVPVVSRHSLPADCLSVLNNLSNLSFRLSNNNDLNSNHLREIGSPNCRHHNNLPRLQDGHRFSLNLQGGLLKPSS